MYDYHNRSTSWWSGKRVAIIAALITVIAITAWFVLGYWLDVAHIMWAWFLNAVWRTVLLPNGWNIFGATPVFWLIALAVVLGIVSFLLLRHTNRLPGSFIIPAVAIAIVWALFAGASLFMWGDWNARHYNAATNYVVSDANAIPNTLNRVSSSSRSQVDIVEGTMPDSWERRVASATGAAYVMQKTGDSNANTELMKDTMSYIYSDEGNGSWTGIRNGKNRQPIFGVASWSGTGDAVKTCEFKGEHELNKAFGGSWGMNLNDDIAKFDPNFIYADNDVYGYCDDDKPVIVIPGARKTGLHVQAAFESYGVMIITGSPSGSPKIEFRDNIERGDLPGPAYPVKLVEKQRDALKWSAGRVWPWQSPVGFEATDSASQAGNNTDFLLKGSEDGRLYWVTPLKPHNADSETIVAYGMVAADEMTQGQLNEQNVYVLNDNDPNIVNFNDLDTAVTQAVAMKDPGFFTGADDSSGRIVEFIPTGTDSWTVFAERRGRAVYQINVTGGSRLNTTVINLDDDGEEQPQSEPTESEDESNGCETPSQLSDVEIAQCISRLSEELVSRSSDTTNRG